MLIATTQAVLIWPPATEPASLGSLDGAEVMALADSANLRLIAYGDNHIAVYHVDGSYTFQVETDQSIASLLILAGEPLRVLVGTVGAQLYSINMESGTAQRIRAFDQLSCRKQWHTPWGGPPALRSLAASDRSIYADIHVGSIMRSEDAGGSWEPVNPTVNEDVHQVATCPAAADHVYANTANAVYVSEDRGRSWCQRCGGLDARYGRAIAVHPVDAECLLASVSDGPHGGSGRLYRSDDAGIHWTHVISGFPRSCDNNIDTFQLGFDNQGTAWAAVGNELYTSTDRGHHWTVAWHALAPIRLLACA